MATLKNLKPDQILYKVRKEKAGNTIMRRQVLDEIRIISIDLEKEFAMAKYNGRERKYREWQLKSWRVNKPTVKGRDTLNNPRY